MIHDIYKTMNYNLLQDKQIETIAKVAYNELKQEIELVLKRLKDLRVFNAKYVYPSSVMTIKRNSIYISVPMASIQQDLEYSELREFLIDLKQTLQEVGFKDIYCPMIDIEDKNHSQYLQKQ